MNSNVNKIARRAVALIILGVIMIGLAAACFVLREAKNEKTTMRTGYVGSDGVAHWTDEKSGYVNGQVYVLTESGRTAALVMGVFMVFAGLGMISLCWRAKKSVGTGEAQEEANLK